MKRLLLLVLGIFIFKIGFACECLKRDNLLWNFLFETDVVFIGTLLDIDTVDYKKILHFQIEKSLKNTEDQIVDVITNMGGPDCGIYDIKIGEKWLIFGYKRNKKIFTDRCTKSCKSTNDIYKNSIDEIEQFLKSIGKECTLKDKSVIASGKLSKKGAIGRWIFNHNDDKSQEIRYYSDEGKLDSSFVKKDNKLMQKIIVNYNIITMTVYNGNGKIAIQDIGLDSIADNEILVIHKTTRYFDGGMVMENSEFVSHYDLKFNDLKFNTSKSIEYYVTGVIKSDETRDKHGNRRKRIFNKKGILKREIK